MAQAEFAAPHGLRRACRQRRRISIVSRAMLDAQAETQACGRTEIAIQLAEQRHTGRVEIAAERVVEAVCESRRADRSIRPIDGQHLVSQFVSVQPDEPVGGPGEQPAGLCRCQAQLLAERSRCCDY